MQRIVVGVGDAADHPSIDWIIRRAQREGVDIQLVRGFEMALSDPVDNRRRLDAVADRLTAALPGAAVTTSLLMKTAVDALVDASTETDLVVIGGGHPGGVASALGGSVPLRVASRSHAVTVIVPSGWRAHDAQDVVVGLDDDDTSEVALAFAAREASAAGTGLLVVHAWSPPRAPADRGREQAVHRAELDAALDRARAAAPGLTVRGALTEGTAAAALQEHAATAEALVVGSHRWGPLAGLVLGSTARDLLIRTASPLFVVPSGGPVSTDGTLVSAEEARPAGP